MNRMQQKYKFSRKKEGAMSIAALQSQLFGQLDGMRESSSLLAEQDPLFNQFREDGPLPVQGSQGKGNVLTRAKHLTYSNKGKIEKMKRELVRMEEGEGGNFVTGVQLFQKQVPQFEECEGDSMLREVDSRQLSDLDELRRMIKKTQNNLKKYSQSVYKTQNKVERAADQCGWQLDTGLAIKINRCNLGELHARQPRPKAEAEKIRRRTMTSYNPRRTKAE